MQTDYEFYRGSLLEFGTAGWCLVYGGLWLFVAWWIFTLGFAAIESSAFIGRFMIQFIALVGIWDVVRAPPLRDFALRRRLQFVSHLTPLYLAPALLVFYLRLYERELIGDTLYGFSLALSIAVIVVLLLMIAFSIQPLWMYPWRNAGRGPRRFHGHRRTQTTVHEAYSHNSSSDSSDEGEP